MISLMFIEAVPVIEKLGRSKDLVNRITNSKEGLGGAGGGHVLTAYAGGWLITHPVSAKSAIQFPDTFVPNANIRCVEGTEEELRAAYAPKKA